jgi:catecholate siderophore receptor
MKKQHRHRKRQRQLFEAMVRRWGAKQWNPGRKQPKQDLTRSLISAIGAAAFIGMGTMAWAQDSDPTQLPEVVVPGRQERESYKPEALSSPKYTEPLRNVPQTVTVVPQAVIQEQGATSLRDVLRGVSGISIQAGEGGVPAGDNLSVRGFSSRTDLFIDGVRDFGGYSRDPFNLEQVEVSKGPASSYAGRGSTGGSINLVSKSPRLNSFYEGTLRSGSADNKRTTLDFNRSLDVIGLKGTALRLNALWQDSEVSKRDEVTDERWGIAPSLALGLGTPTRVTLSYFQLDQNNTPDYGIPWVPANTGPLAAYSDQPAPVNYSNFYGLLNRDFEKTLTNLGTIQAEHDLTDSFRLRNLLRYGKTERDSVITAPRFANVNTNTSINRQLQSRDQDDTILANQTDLISNFKTGPISHALVTGLEYTRETSKNRLRSGATAPTADLYNPNPNDPYTSPITPTGATTDGISEGVALYTFDTIKLGDQWQVNGGLRWDYFDVGFESRATNGVPTPLDRTDRMFSWRAGVVYEPLTNGSIYTGFGTSFNPSAEGLSLGSTATSTNSVNTAPEKSQTFEIGTKWDLFRQRLALSAAIFRTEKTNARTEDPTNSADVIVLEGKQRVDGLEFGLAGQITDKWQMFGGYTLMASEIVESKNVSEIGHELSNTPKNTFTLWTAYQLPWSIEAGAGVQLIDDRFSNNANTRTAPGYWLFDAMVAYEVNQNFNLRLNGYNLANKDYIDRVGGGHFIPGAGRAATMTGNFKF